MKRVLLYEDKKEIGTYTRVERYYDNDDYEIYVYDRYNSDELGELTFKDPEFDDLGFDINLN